MDRRRTTLLAFASGAALLVAGLWLPSWLLFLLTLVASHGIVSVGILIAMRGGLVSFGQGLSFAIGGYAAALPIASGAITDVILLVLIGALAGLIVAAIFAPLLARYNGIFFGMLTLALSMVVYGALIKASALGGSDGFNTPKPSLFGQRLEGASGDYRLFAISVLLTGVPAWLTALHLRSTRGLATLAAKSNEVRVEYLGISARELAAVNFALAGFLGGLGGALTALALGHIEPSFAYWTQSGEFVFVAILAGPSSVSAIFLASLLLETVRSFSNLYFPNTWQLAIGLFLLVVILFLPDGIGSLARRKRRQPGRTPGPAVSTTQQAEAAE